MAGVLALYLDPEVAYTWRQSSLVVAKTQGTRSGLCKGDTTMDTQFLSLENYHSTITRAGNQAFLKTRILHWKFN